MKGFSGQYMNELVSLTILALMAIALVAGQADATLQETAHGPAVSGSQAPDLTLEAIVAAPAIRADVAIAIDFEGFAALASSDAEHGTRIEIRTPGRR